MLRLGCNSKVSPANSIAKHEAFTPPEVALTSNESLLLFDQIQCGTRSKPINLLGIVRVVHFDGIT